MRAELLNRIVREFGSAARETVKVKAWNLGEGRSAVLQIDQPSAGRVAYLWLPYPADGQVIPEIALEYAGGSGRHSGTYAAPGLEKGEPALKLTVSSEAELEATLGYMKALQAAAPLPEVRRTKPSQPDPLAEPASVTPAVGFAEPPPMRPRREAIPRTVQREVWQRDGGRCVECGTRERLCFDHIVPFSRGGGNSVRNIQLLCEPCNLSKGNRL